MISNSKIILNVENLKKIVALCEITFNKKFVKIEIESLLNYINKLDMDRLFKKFKSNLDNINIEIANTYKKYIDERRDFDLQEYMKNNIVSGASKMTSSYAPAAAVVTSSAPTAATTVTAVSTGNSPSIIDTPAGRVELTRTLNRESLYRDANILIDSRYQNLANTDKSKLSFSIASDTKVKIPGSGIITASGVIKDIVEIEIFPFSIPYLAMADNYYKKITMSILELSSVSFDAYENSQFHFMFNTVKNQNLIDLTPLNSTFRFSKPISKISEFTLRFGSPLEPIIFEKDRARSSSIDYTSNPARISFPDDHNLSSGDIIYIDEFTTNNPAQDLAIINSINTKSGHICTKIDPNTISFNIDMNLISDPNTNLSITVYFGSKRIFMPMRIRYLQGVE